jgi:hypothetical protein
MSGGNGLSSNKTMSAKERKEALERYLAQSPESIALLMHEMGGQSLDFSPSSLVRVWKHFQACLTTREKTAEEWSEIPEWATETTTTVMFTEETKLRIVRTAFYLGEVFTRQCPHLKWEIAKSGVYRDKPVLTGFRHGLEFCPLNLVEVQAWKAVRRQADKTELMELFDIWRVKVC